MHCKKILLPCVAAFVTAGLLLSTALEAAGDSVPVETGAVIQQGAAYENRAGRKDTGEREIRERSEKEHGGKLRNGKKHWLDKRGFSQDPVKSLEKVKEKVRLLQEEGVITKEKADMIIARIDGKIKALEEFNKLTPEQKREKLTKDFERFIEMKVQKGKLTKDEAEKLKKQFKKDIMKYDGKGYPDFLDKYFRMKRDPDKGNNR